MYDFIYIDLAHTIFYSFHQPCSRFGTKAQKSYLSSFDEIILRVVNRLCFRIVSCIFHLFEINWSIGKLCCFCSAHQKNDISPFPSMNFWKNIKKNEVIFRYTIFQQILLWEVKFMLEMKAKIMSNWLIRFSFQIWFGKFFEIIPDLFYGTF